MAERAWGGTGPPLCCIRASRMSTGLPGIILGMAKFNVIAAHAATR